MPVTLYEGTKFDTNVATIIPHDPAYLPAIWCFCKSPEFYAAVRRIDQKVNVTNATLVKVPFDLERWQQVAAEEYPNGLPEPHSDDPTQWLFKGHPEGLDRPAPGRRGPAARLPLAGSGAGRPRLRWPTRTASCPSPPCGAKPPAAERLREVLRTAFGSEWSASLENKLLDRGRGEAGHDARRLAPQQLLRAALQAVPQPPLRLAHLGRPQGRLRLPGQLPQARSRPARNPDLLLPPGLDQRPGRRRESEQDRRRSSPRAPPRSCRRS